jgi:hypothetical protein
LVWGNGGANDARRDEHMSEELEAKLQGQNREERELIDVVYRALGDDLVRVRRFLEMALTKLQSEEATSDRVTVVDPEEVRPNPPKDR